MRKSIAAALITCLAVSLMNGCGMIESAGILGREETAESQTASDAESVGESEPEIEEEEIERPEFRIGEAWTVDGQWSMTVLGATLTEERNEFSDVNPTAVYIVDYTYTNLGYTDSIMDGLYISLDHQILDSTGAAGYVYPATIAYYPENVPVGATCRAQACIGVDNPGTFTINLSMFDPDMKQQAASFIIDPDAEHAEMAIPSVTYDDSEALGIGQTWTVDGQWSLTLTGVVPSEERNEFSDKNPTAAYVVDYEYTNLGYQDTYGDDSTATESGLYMTIDSQIVDSAGVMGYSYAGPAITYPEPIPVGETCHAQECIGVEHPGNFRLTVNMYDSTGTKQSQMFLVTVP